MVALSHPNIVEAYSAYFSAVNDSFIMVNELCDYGSLKTLINQKREAKEMIPERIIRVIMMDLVSAFYHVHDKNWLHLDMKAANVLVTIDGVVKLCDFGIATRLQNQEK